MNPIKLSTILLILFCTNLLAQSEDSDTAKADNFIWFAYPFAFYSPETSLAFGAGGIISFKLSEKFSSKPSSITASGYYSINNQYDLTIQPEVYLADDKYKIWSKFNYGKIFDFFYGVGNRAEEI